MAHKFTPGPWEAIQNDDPRGQPVAHYRGLVCTVEHSPDRYLAVVAENVEHVSREEWPHNARLIASAPDLYEALKAVEWAGRNSEDGDPCCPFCDVLAVQEGKPLHNDGCVLDAALKSAQGEAK